MLTTRGNYGKLKTTMAAVAAHPGLRLQVVVGGALVQEQYGDYRPVLEADGFQIDSVLDYMAEEDSLQGIGRSAARCAQMFVESLAELSPHVVLLVADRYEVLALAMSAVCLNTVIAHLEGGEVSGSIDERLRHAVTKLAHIHLPASRAAAERIVRMGEAADTVHIVGTPSLDLLKDVDLSDLGAAAAGLAQRGTGRQLSLESPYVIVSQHPVVTEVDEAPAQYRALADAAMALELPVLWIMPNLDAGASAAATVVAELQSDPTGPPILSVGSLPFEIYAALLANARCLIGNTSSGIREGAYLGVPVVNVGTRQRGRARGHNVVDVADGGAHEIIEAARAQIAHGRYPQDPIYGDGTSGARICAALAGPLPALDKPITY